ncbi:MAG: RluA family pseudouridine synthase [Anaerolineales bacterium]|nr:RluA family pseudouridine synthase [Anaerolineales bacterium]
MTPLDEGPPALEGFATPGRLDSCLNRQWPEVSRSRWQQLIREGTVTVDGRIVDKPGLRLVGGERISAVIPPARPAMLEPSQIPLHIVFEDDNILIADKAAGVVVHPSAGHEADTLVQAVLNHVPDLVGVGGERRPGVVHRLDKDTSGLVVFAKNDRAMADLQRQFKSQAVTKTYLALIHGNPPTEEGLVDAAIGRDPRERKRMAVVAEHKGRSSLTRFHVLRRLGEYALLAVTPQTGRTHQIRVHLAYLGMPVAGDRVYGSRHQPDWLRRQMLHAWRLGIRLPGASELSVFEAALPADFREALELLQTGIIADLALESQEGSG